MLPRRDSASGRRGWVGCHGPRRMARGRTRNTGGTDRILDRTLDNGFVQVMSAALAGRLVHVEPRRGENPLPRLFQGGRSVCNATRRQPHGATELREERRYFVAGQHHREADRPLRGRCRSSTAVAGQGQPRTRKRTALSPSPGSGLTQSRRRWPGWIERCHFQLPEFLGMPLPVEDDESPNPGDVGVLGPATLMPHADRLSHAIERRSRESLDNERDASVGG